MGLFDNFNFGRAAIGFFNPEAGQALRQRDIARAQGEEERRRRSVVQQAAEQMGIPKQVINTLSDEDLSRLVLQRSQPRQYDSGGGSAYDPITQQTYIAPSERTIGPDIIRTNSQGQATPVYQGIDSVAVPPGGGLYGVTGQGVARELIAPFGSPPQGAPQLPAPNGPIPQAQSMPGTFSFNRVPGDTETSGYRTPERNRQVGGVPNSFHTVRDAQGNPMASDRVPPPGMSMDAFASALRRQNPHLDVINEGDHVHLEPRGQSPAGQLPRPNSRADVDRLPSGAMYIAPDGSIRRKR